MAVISEIATISDLLTRPEFIAGLVAGVILLTPFMWSTRADGLPGWGLAMAAATLVGVQLTVGRRLGLTVGVVFMAAGGWLIERRNASVATKTSNSETLGWALVVVGAVLTSWRSGLPEVSWILFVTPLAAIGFGQALRFWGGYLKSALGPLFLMTAVGIWTTVPDTEAARVLVGASLALAPATIRGLGGRIAAPGAFALGGVLAWVSALGGATRPASVIGGWACAGILGLIPLLHRSFRGVSGLSPAVLFLAHAILVFVAARVIGLWETAALAVLAVAALAAVATGVVLTLAPSPSSRAP